MADRQQDPAKEDSESNIVICRRMNKWKRVNDIRTVQELLGHSSVKTSLIG